MSDSDDKERFWNFLVFKMWVTDKELDELGPFLAGATLVLLVIIGLLVWFFN